MSNIHIAIDVDGSPSGYISWHNHFQNKGKIRTLKPYKKDERFGVQRMEMLAIYFAISDNLKAIRKKLKRKGKRNYSYKKRFKINNRAIKQKIKSKRRYH